MACDMSCQTAVRRHLKLLTVRSNN